MLDVAGKGIRSNISTDLCWRMTTINIILFKTEFGIKFNPPDGEMEYISSQQLNLPPRCTANRKKKSSHIYYHIHNSRQRHFSENINMKNVEFMLNEINPWYDYICLGGKCKFVFYFRWFSVYSRAFRMNALIPLSYEGWHYVKKICMFGFARKKLSSGSSGGAGEWAM